MRDEEPDRVERGFLLVLFLVGVFMAGLIILCLGWGSQYVR
jgi:hypothetical protein